MTRLRLRNLQFFARVGLTALVGVLGLGLWASAQHLANHYEKRDGVPGLTRADIEASFRGLDAPAPFAASLGRGHPEALSHDERDALIRWLSSDRIAEDYDSLDRGDDAPAEIIARQCLSCHSRNASPPADQVRAVDLPLDYWDDVTKIAFARSIPATPREIIIMSLHAHAITMGLLTIVVGALAIASAFPRWLTGLVIAGAGLALLADFACWLLAPRWAPAIDVMIGAGFAANGATALLLAFVVLELWRPRTARDIAGAAP